ncbi:MAG: choice-of-anchor F family protein [Halioglobus sp.]
MTNSTENQLLAFSKTAPFKHAILAVAVMSASVVVQAGKISTNQCTDSVAGFGGWSLDNVEILMPDGQTFDSSCGTYDTDPEGASFSYAGDVKNGLGTIMGQVLAKDWPVGEPPGIKVVHDDQAVKPPKPQNCIMSTSYLEDHFLDSDDPQQVTCSGPFQSHKRYKLAMLPSTVEGVEPGSGNEKGIDVVFNVEAEEGERDYQVFQKINNWTGKRLEGFTIQVGTGLGDSFVAAGTLATDTETGGVGVANLSLSVPVEVWDSESQLANFSTGLFGPVDNQHDRPAGYFDPDTRAGFKILEYGGSEDGNASGQIDTLHSDGPLGSSYSDLPAGAGATPGNQFGPWLPNSMLPQGIFWDDDGNPATDAQLVAWYGYNPSLLGLSWMNGAAGEFTQIPAGTIESWGSNLTYTMGEIDDLVNVGLNYIVTIGDVVDFGGTFTIRITPQLDSSGAGDPAYKDQTPAPILTFGSPAGVVEISPWPSFEVGSLLTARVGDGSLDLGEEVTVNVRIDEGPDFPLTLIEQGEDRGVFAASLSDEFSNLDPGQSITVSYIDADNGNDETDLETSVTTIAIAEGEPPLPAPAEVAIIDLSVPESLFDGKTRVLSLSIQSSKESESLASGSVTLTGSDAIGSSFTEEFVDLKIGGKKKFNFKWQAILEDPAVPETVVWTATLDLDEGESTETEGSTLIEVKVKGKDR